MNYHIIKKPIITEKSLSRAKSENVYTFLVAKLANKDQIREVVEAAFGVKVMMVRSGKKRVARMTPERKKAYIHVKPGQKINLFDIQGE